MEGFSYTPNATMASIRNPYRSSNSINSYRSSSPSSSSSSSSASVSTSSLPRNPMGPSEFHGAAASSSGTETMVRDLIRSAEHSAGGVPSLSLVKGLLERVQLQRSEFFHWSPELAQGFGRIVVGCVRSFGLWRDESNEETGNSDSSITDAPNRNSESVGVMVMELLANVIRDWEDHVLYAALVQDKSISQRGSAVQSTHETLLDALTLLSVPSDNRRRLRLKKEHRERIRQTSTMCLATAWRSLDRLEYLTTLTNGDHTRSTWWISDERAMNSLAVRSFQSLFQLYGCSKHYSSHADQQRSNEHQISAASSPDQERQKVASLTILVILLRHQVLNVSTSPTSDSISRSSTNEDCVLPESILTELISKLIKGIQILNHSILPPSSSEHTLPIAMLSMSALSLLQRSLTISEHASLFRGVDQTIQSTGLVENLVQFTFFSTSRWVSMASNHFQKDRLQSFGLHLFSCWKFCDGAAWRAVVVNLEPKIRSIVAAFWSNLLQTGSTHDPNLSSGDCSNLRGIIWLYITVRNHARYSLDSVLEDMHADPIEATHSFPSQRNSSSHRSVNKMKVLRKIIYSLFGTLRLSSGASYSTRLMTSRLLRIMLTDRRFASSNDELSRSIWRAIDQSVIEDHLETVLEHADTDDTNQPLLLTLVDTMETLLEYEEKRNYFVDNLAAHNLETLIYLIKPRDVRYDFSLGGDDVVGINTETPPLHNLSRMDETSICIEHEETKEPKGFDHPVRLSVATSLARLAYSSSTAPPNESIALLMSRISSAVNDFLVEYHARIEGGEIERNIANKTITTTPSMDQTKRFMRLQQACATPENEEFLSSIMFTGMSLHRKQISFLVDAQKETEYNLQMTLEREKIAQEEKVKHIQRLGVQSVIFQRELSRAKLNMEQDSRQLISMHASERASAEERLNVLQQKAEHDKSELERVKSEAESTIEELQKTKSKIEELDGTIGTLQQELKDEKAKAKEITQELETNRARIQAFEEKCGDMRSTVEEKEDTISRMEDTNHQLQDNLEDLFADMCSLAQIHEHNENEENSQKLKNAEEIEAVNQKLTTERQRNEELVSKMKDVQEENDKLYRKLAKYKERLELERRSRRDDQNKKKEEDDRRKRSGPVSYINSLHTSTTSDMTQSRSKSMRSSRTSSQRAPTGSSQYKSRDRSMRDMSMRGMSIREHSIRGNSDKSIHEKENSHASSNHPRSSRSQRRLES